MSQGCLQRIAGRVQHSMQTNVTYLHPVSNMSLKTKAPLKPIRAWTLIGNTMALLSLVLTFLYVLKSFHSHAVGVHACVRTTEHKQKVVRAPCHDCLYNSNLLTIRRREFHRKGLTGNHSHGDLVNTAHEPWGRAVQPALNHSDANTFMESVPDSTPESTVETHSG